MSGGFTIRIAAPAKVNLALHVVGRRTDGYHELDGIAVFADVGDTVILRSDPAAVSLSVTAGDPGCALPADLPAGTSNLVWRALAALGRHCGGIRGGLSVTLEKRLPSGAGLGGGSADAAAVLAAAAGLVADPPDGTGLARLALTLGADVPMCLDSLACRTRGIGERIEPLTAPEPIAAVLVWPGVPLSTPAVFAERRGDFGDFLQDSAVSCWTADPIGTVAAMRNDLQEAAIRLEPGVGRALEAVAGTIGCRVARMSGSGTAVFGLYDRATDAEAAATLLAKREPSWWVRPTRLGSRPDRTYPA